ncbi:Cytochrome C biogenesis protein CcmE [Candidatus Hydrogenisulfobacillus filiaventi]|uniref:Cytochrome C biogenesis protein CcmE n=1 Tax=Candidatus Hydrogenisulfobacillus filiaventi TaxID=2707344 RepID=A0A6F8ZH35_9FIRM|nr:cytochrome c maturation protein CcmE [Bacillota bacterium]CAB1128989.1 Cytochrome C biogenesis protein CcmE [Candidatus Hydrogenisulfobacillus filiaventi]
MSKQLRLYAGTAAVVAAILYLGWMGARNFSNYFMPVNQYRAEYARYAGKVVRVQGRLLGSSVRFNPRQGTLRFTLLAHGASLPVLYTGPVPNEKFKNTDAIVEGRMDAQGVFVADKLAIQCPDHYQAAPSKP